MTETPPDDDTTSDGPTIKSITLLGRACMVRRPNEMQVVVMKGALTRFSKSGNNLELGVDALAKVLDVIQTLFVDATDRMWLEDRMIDGTLAWSGDDGISQTLTVWEDDEKAPAAKSASRVRRPRK